MSILREQLERLPHTTEVRTRLQKELLLARALGDRQLQAELLLKLALVMRDIGTGDGGSFETAVETMCRQAAEVFQELGNEKAVAACLRCSLTFHDQETYDERLSQAESLSKGCGDELGYAAARLRRAALCSVDEAKALFDEAEAIYTAHQDEAGLGRLYFSRGIKFQSAADLRTAERLLISAEDFELAGKAALTQTMYDKGMGFEAAAGSMMRAAALQSVAGSNALALLCWERLREHFWRLDKDLALLFGRASQEQAIRPKALQTCIDWAASHGEAETSALIEVLGSERRQERALSNAEHS